jgi:FkbM family methyltransferase
MDAFSDITQSIRSAEREGFSVISRIVNDFGIDEIIEAAAQETGVDAHSMAEVPMDGYSKTRIIGTYRDYLTDLSENIDQYAWLYSRLEDFESRRAFNNLALFRLTGRRKYLWHAYDGENPQYFDKKIIKTDENEVLADCGGFTGDTVQSYITHCGKYKKIYVYEPSAEYMSYCRKNLAGYDRIEFRPFGVGEKNDRLPFIGGGPAGSFLLQNENEEGNRQLVVSLDEDIDEPLTFIKLDVEGFEMAALRGAARHITAEKPKLAVCLYHIIADFWEIPQLIHAMHSGYRFYLRHYDRDHNWETTLYAVSPR